MPCRAPGWFIAMHLAELGDFQWQVTIGFETILEDLHMARTVHRFAAEDALVRGLGGEHVFTEFFPVSRLFPQAYVSIMSGLLTSLIVPALLTATHIGDHRSGTGSSPCHARKRSPALLPENGTDPFHGQACGDRVFPLLPDGSDGTLRSFSLAHAVP